MCAAALVVSARLLRPLTARRLLTSAAGLGVAELPPRLPSVRPWVPGHHQRGSFATDVEYRDRAPVDAHYVSDQPDVEQPRRLFRRFPVGVGGRLALVAPAGVREVDVGVGALEEICVEVTSDSGDIQSLATFDFAESSGAVSAVGMAAASAPAGAALHMKAWVPERFCSVDITAEGAAVAVRSVIEASLRVHSGGGDVKLGTVRASDAEVSTGGGALDGAITAYTVAVATGGGPLQLKRLVGRRVELDSAGGDVGLRVVYGDDIVVRSGGGAVTINSAKISESGVVHSGGGAVNVLGADGRLTLRSGGGNVEVQMHAEAQSVDIDSGGGSVGVALPTDCAFRLRAAAGGGVVLEEGITVEGRVEGDEVEGVASVRGAALGRKAQAVAGYSWREAGMEELLRQQEPAGDPSAAGGALVVEAGEGRAAFRVQSWMDSLAKKFAAPKEEEADSS